MCIFKTITAPFLVLLGLIASAFAEADAPGVTMSKQPSYLSIYYPFRITRFPVDSAKSTFKPIPEYDNWSIDRIDRDLARMVNCGLNGVLLAIEPSDITDVHKMDMIRTFLVLASKNQGFKVAFLFAPIRKTQLSRSNVSNFLKRKGLLDYSSNYRYSDSSVIFVSDNVELVSTGKSEFIFFTIGLSIKKDADSDAIGLVTYPTLSLGSNDVKTSFKVVEVFASFFVENDKNQWLVSRKNGHSFHHFLEEACKVSPNIVVISSWNDYFQGSAIENNTYDNSQMQDILKNFMKTSNK